MDIDGFRRAQRAYESAPKGTSDASLLRLLELAIMTPVEPQECEENRERRNHNFLLACGKFEKGRKPGGDIGRVEQLFQQGPVDINKPDDDGWSPLLHAAGEGNAKICTFLVEVCGANIDYQCPDDGTTALWAAAFNGRSEATYYLLSVGADERLKGKGSDGKMQTPAMAARRNRKPGIADFIDLETKLRDNDPIRRQQLRNRELTYQEWRISIKEKVHESNKVT